MAENLSSSSLLDKLASGSLLWRIFLDRENSSRLDQAIADIQGMLHGQIPYVSRRLRKTEEMNAVASTLLRNVNRPGIEPLINFLEQDQEVEVGPPVFRSGTVVNVPKGYKKIAFALGYEMHMAGVDSVDSLDLESIAQKFASTVSGMVVGKSLRDLANTTVFMGIVLPGFLEEGLQFAKSSPDEELPPVFANYLRT